VHGGIVCIFETHRKQEEVIDGERGLGLPGLRQTIVLVIMRFDGITVNVYKMSVDD